MLIRRLARPMLATVFVQGGARSLRDAKGSAKAIRPFLDKTVGRVRDSLPERVRTDAETLIRIDGAIKIGAGTMLALGKFPRLSALLLAGTLVPTTLAAHAYWEHDDPEQRDAQQIHFMKNLGLLGGLLIVAVDTKGKPSLAYRAKHRAGHSADAVRRVAR